MVPTKAGEKSANGEAGPEARWCSAACIQLHLLCASMQPSGKYCVLDVCYRGGLLLSHILHIISQTTGGGLIRVCSGKAGAKASRPHSECLLGRASSPKRIRRKAQ
jgi:hypothetical protein